MVILKLLVQVITFLLSMSILSCSQGWTIAGLEITPSDTTKNTVFIEIIGADSVEHWYHGRLYSDGNWCYKHEQYEYVEAK